MAVSNLAVFAQNPRTAYVNLTAAKINLTDSTSTGLLLTASGNGSICTGIWFTPRNTETGIQGQAYLVQSATSSTYNLMTTVLIPAYTLTTTSLITPTAVNLPSNALPISPTNLLYLAPSDSIYVATAVAVTSGVMAIANFIDL